MLFGADGVQKFGAQSNGTYYTSNLTDTKIYKIATAGVPVATGAAVSLNFAGVKQTGTFFVATDNTNITYYVNGHLLKLAAVTVGDTTFITDKDGKLVITATNATTAYVADGTNYYQNGATNFEFVDLVMVQGFTTRR